MTCREFDTVVAELVRGEAATPSSDDLAVREAGEAHAAECRACANRLIAEQRLTLALRALATSSVETSSHETAADAAEGRLLEVFRKQHAPVAPALVADANVIPMARRQRAPLYWAASIAAGVALLALLATWNSGGGPRTEFAKNSQTPQAPVNAAPEVTAAEPDVGDAARRSVARASENSRVPLRAVPAGPECASPAAGAADGRD